MLEGPEPAGCCLHRAAQAAPCCLHSQKSLHPPCPCLAAIPAEQQSQLRGSLPTLPAPSGSHFSCGTQLLGLHVSHPGSECCRAPLHPGRAGVCGVCCVLQLLLLLELLWFLIAEQLLSPGTQQDLAFLLNISCRHMQTEAPACFQFGFSLLLEVHK